jgi:hypothetical protein
MDAVLVQIGTRANGCVLVPTEHGMHRVNVDTGRLTPDEGTITYEEWKRRNEHHTNGKKEVSQEDQVLTPQ